MRAFTVSLALGLTSAVYACGGGGGGSTNPITEAEAQGPCGQLCEKDEACSPGGEPVSACTSECVAALAGWVREDAMNEFADCVSDAACEVEGAEEACIREIDLLPAHRNWQTACQAKLVGCPDVDPARDCNVESGVGDVITFRLIAPSIMDELTACLDGADCEQKFACLEMVVTKYGIDL